MPQSHSRYAIPLSTYSYSAADIVRGRLKQRRLNSTAEPSLYPHFKPNLEQILRATKLWDHTAEQFC